MEIGKKLPQKNRLDLQTEIRSTIEDMLEDRPKQTERPVDNTMIEEVLKEYGSPAKVAASYHPTRYLIGPQIYPFFMTVVKIVLGVLFAVTLEVFYGIITTTLPVPHFMDHWVILRCSSSGVRQQHWATLFWCLPFLNASCLQLNLMNQKMNGNHQI